MMRKHYLTGYVLATLLMVASLDALAVSEVQYQLLPTDTVVNNVKSDLQNHGIDPAAINVEADDRGIVKLSGAVASQQEALAATRVAMKSAGVYAVLGALRYEGQASEVSRPAEITPEAAPALMDAAPAAGADETAEPNAW